MFDAFGFPYFTCDTALQPLSTLKIPYKFYKINSKQGGDKSIYPDILFLVCNQHYGIDGMERMINATNSFR